MDKIEAAKAPLKLERRIAVIEAKLRDLTAARARLLDALRKGEVSDA